MSAGLAETPLHSALVAAIKGDATCKRLISGRVFEWPRPGESYPMVTIGELVSAPNDTGDSVGSEIDATIHTWAQGGGGRIVARQVGDAISNLLHRMPANLTVEGFKVVTVHRVFSAVYRDEASEADAQSPTAHGVYRFKIQLHATGAFDRTG